MRTDTKLINFFILSLLAVLIIPLVGARADISDIYITTSCDPTSGVAKIAIDQIDEGDVRPEGSKLLSSVNDHRNPTGPLTICSLGKKRDISLLGLVNPDHPRNDNLNIYIGSSEYPRRIFFNFPQIHSIIFKAIPEDFYLSVEECDYKGACQNQLYTDPSFDCRKATSVVEKMICAYQPLAKLDVELDKIYRDAIRTSKEPQKITADQMKWRQQRSLACNIFDAEPGWSSGEEPLEVLSGNGPLIQEHCLEEKYHERIIEIKVLA
jgi:uncharacterized protein YecT (DUF1311 family)